MKSRRGFAPIFIVLIIAALVLAGGFVYQKVRQEKAAENLLPEATTTAEMAGWQTYINNTYGLTAKYPSPVFVTNISNVPDAAADFGVSKNGPTVVDFYFSKASGRLANELQGCTVYATSTVSMSSGHPIVLYEYNQCLGSEEGYGKINMVVGEIKLPSGGYVTVLGKKDNVYYSTMIKILESISFVPATK